MSAEPETPEWLNPIIKWFATALCLIALFFTFRVIVPGLVNSQHDSAIILAILVAITVPAALALLLYNVWKGESE